VGVDDVVERVFRPAYTNQAEVPITLYGTDRRGAKFTTETDMQKIADLVVSMVDEGGKLVSGDPDECPIRVELSFGKAQLTMTARNVATGVVQKTDIVFAHSCC
jgi:hypothetical protein